MDKLKIGLVVNFAVSPASGGTYSYTQTLLKAINEYPFDEGIEICNIVFDDMDGKAASLPKPSLIINEKKKKESAVSRHFNRFMDSNPVTYYVKKKAAKKQTRILENRIKEFGVDLLFFISQFGSELNYPYIINHWDLAHKSTYPFPEITFNGTYEYRNLHFLALHNKALFVLCESEASIREVEKYLSISPKKLKLLPIFGSNALKHKTDIEIETTLKKYELVREAFFIYPAQFWALKNHYNLILAFKEFVEKTGKPFKLVLTGADHGTKNYIQDVVNQHSLKDQVVFAGFISDDDLSALYQSACALVFPTFLGPTNMPLLEATRFHCPVLCSDLEGHREQMADTALYFEPTDASEMAKAMMKIATDNAFRTELIERAFTQVSQSKFNLESSMKALNTIFLEAKSIRKTWGR